MSKQYDVYYVYGTTSPENPGPKVRKDTKKAMYEDEELHHGIVSAEVVAYGDDLSYAFITVVSVSEDTGRALFKHLNQRWNFMLEGM